MRRVSVTLEIAVPNGRACDGCAWADKSGAWCHAFGHPLTGIKAPECMAKALQAARHDGPSDAGQAFADPALDALFAVSKRAKGLNGRRPR
jgi:hypothetical protein